MVKDNLGESGDRCLQVPESCTIEEAASTASAVISNWTLLVFSGLTLLLWLPLERGISLGAQVSAKAVAGQPSEPLPKGMERAYGLLCSNGAAATSEDEKAVEAILGSYPPSEIIRFLKESLGDKSEPVRRVKAAAALEIAARRDAFRSQAEDQIRTLAMAAAGDEDPAVFEPALWTLRWWSEDPEIVALLKGRLQKERDPQVLGLLFGFFEKRGALLLLEELDRPIPPLGTKERSQWQARMEVALTYCRVHHDDTCKALIFGLTDLIEKCPALADGACRCLVSAGDKEAAAVLTRLRDILPERARIPVDATSVVLAPGSDLKANLLDDFRAVSRLCKEGHRSPDEVSFRFQWLCFLAARTWDVDLTGRLMKEVESEEDVQLRNVMLRSFTDEARPMGMLMVLGLAELPQEILKAFLAKDPERLRAVAIQLSPGQLYPATPPELKDRVKAAQTRLRPMVDELRHKR